MILNLTQHPATEEQVAEGVTEPADKAGIKKLLTFDDLPSKAEIERTAEALALVAADSGAEWALIGGAPFFMSALERALKNVGVSPVYAFSRREVVETVAENGAVVKTAVFRHAGFIPA